MSKFYEIIYLKEVYFIKAREGAQKKHENS